MRRSLIHHWRTSAAVVAGAAVATAILTGALVVGDSVRGSLRGLALDRLGRIETIVALLHPVRAGLADELESRLEPGGAVAPAIVLPGSAVHSATGARATGVSILGVDGRLGDLYPGEPVLVPERGSGLLLPPVVLSAALAEELGAAIGDDVLLTFEMPSEVPEETLVGRRDVASSVGRMRLSVADVRTDRGVGGFALRPHQGRPLNAFVDLARLARRLWPEAEEERATLLLVAGADPVGVESALRGCATLGDLGIEVAQAPGGEVVLGSRELVLSPPVAATLADLGTALGATVEPVLTYLANEIRGGEGTVPYSTVSALEPASVARLRLTDGRPPPPLGADEILLDAWAAEDLAIEVGAEVELEYYVVGPRDELGTERARFRLAGVVAKSGLAADPTLTPDLPGLQDADDISAWEPPFPLDLARVRPRDEAYWDDYRAAPKAFVSAEAGRRLWGSRFGDRTSLRLAETLDLARFEADLRRTADLGSFGFELLPARSRALEGARGGTDFAGLFLGLSMFLIGSAALLVALVFRLGVEQRAGEVGLLRATGYAERAIERRFLAEGVTLGSLGAVLGLAGAVVYGELVLGALRTRWRPAVGTSHLELVLEPVTLVLGAVASLAVVALTVLATVRFLRRVPVPRLLAGDATLEVRGGRGRSRSGPLAAVSGLLGTLVAVFALASGRGSSAGLAFASAALLLVAGVAGFARLATRPPRAPNQLGRFAWWGMGARNAGRHWSRSIAAVALIASATFLVVAVGANRGEGGVAVEDRESGAGGYTLLATTDVALLPDLERDDVRRELGFSADESATLEGLDIVPFRLRPGEDASCLNLYRPERPRVLGVPPELVARGGFDFQKTEPATAEPWRLLEADLGPGVVPAFGDAASVQWILHKGLGDDVEVVDERGEPLRLRLVGLLARSVFQGELLVAEDRFERHFPSRTGYRVFLLDPPAARATEVATLLESRLESIGFDATPTAERLAAFQAVENTYLATFQSLGGLGLLLGTLGLGIVVLRNVVERRRELAALRAFGFRRPLIAAVVVAENLVLLLAGVAVGGTAGAVAVAPRLLETGHLAPLASVASTLALVVTVGAASSVAAVVAALRAPLVPALKGD